MDISVVIVGWNARDYLQGCLESLEAAPPRRTMEVFVLDNASEDGSADMIESRFPWVKLIRSSENLGFAKGNNVAIRQCQGRHICLVNPDVKVLPGCLDSLAEFLDEHEDVGMVGPRVLYGDMTLQISCRHFPTLWNNFCAATGFASAFRHSRFFSGEQMHYFGHDRTQPVDAVMGCFLMVRREALDGIGLMDEGFYMYGDDVDWCRRCWDAGWKVVFYPGARAIHYLGKITAPYPVRFAIARQKSVLYYWSKYHGFFGVLGIRSVMLIHHILRYVSALLAGLSRAGGRGQVEVKKQVSAACLWAVLTNRVPQKG